MICDSREETGNVLRAAEEGACDHLEDDEARPAALQYPEVEDRHEQVEGVVGGRPSTLAA